MVATMSIASPTSWSSWVALAGAEAEMVGWGVGTPYLGFRARAVETAHVTWRD